jgi:TolB-like protein/class 3 adenylate cyclase/Tfp pilus assembly protein PilF
MTDLAAGEPQRGQKAILFADVSDYGRRMAEDEVGTYELVIRWIGRLRSLIGAYDGRIVDTAGDGVFAVFEGASEAVDFAIAVQRDFRDDAIWQEGRKSIPFRIGINAGAVLIDGEKVSGHNVNIAARIESVAPPGGICVSAAVAQALRERTEVRVRSIGHPRLKNIPEPVEVFTVEAAGLSPSFGPAELPAILTEGGAAGVHDSTVEAVLGPSIVVLPLTNVTGDPAAAHVCDGVTQDIITNLTHFRDLLVIARRSAFAFRDTDLGNEALAGLLGVRYILTGGLMQSGKKVRINVRLIDAIDDRVVWSQRYEGDLADLFAFQDEVTAIIAARLSIEVNVAERRRLSESAPDLRAYGLILRGDELSLRVARAACLHARQLFEEATKIDPRYARSYAGLSRTYHRTWRFKWVDPPMPSLDRAVKLAEQAIDVDPSDARGHAALGWAQLFKRQHDESLAAYAQAISLNPNDADVLAEMGHAVSCCGETERGVSLLKRAMRLNPYAPDWYLWHLGEAYFDLGDYEQAIRTLNKMHDKSEAYRLLTASYALVDRMDEARAHKALLLKTHPDFSLAHWRTVPPDRNPEPRERLITGLRKAGVR